MGYWDDLGGVRRGFVYDYKADLTAGGGTYTPWPYPIPRKVIPVESIEFPEAFYVYITGVNSQGVITGYASFPYGSRGFIGTPNP